MYSFSLCMIVKDEDIELQSCLESVKGIFDEIIIVSTAHSEKTELIAKKYTDNIFNFEWINDFSAARNFSYSKATKDYIMWLDADDIITEKDYEKLLDLKTTLQPSTDIVLMKYVHLDPSSGDVSLSYFRERLTKRANSYIWQEPIHEFLSTYGNSISLDIAVTHNKIHPNEINRNLKTYESFISKGNELTPRGLYYYSKELYYNQEYEKAIEHFEKFLSSKKGWVEDNIMTCYLLSKCYNQIKNEPCRLKSLIRSFEYDNPRADLCCELGFYYKDIFEYEKAIFWFKLCTNIKKPENNLGLIYHDYYDFIPSIELCVCYDKLNNEDIAIEYNLKAGEYKPNNSQVLYNKNYYYDKSLSSRINQLNYEKKIIETNRLSYIPAITSNKLGISFFATANALTNIQNLINTYSKFNYKNKELIIFLYESIDLSKIIQIATEENNVKLINVSSNFSNKNCSDFLTITALYDYVSKLNDFDFYGDNYLLDMMNNFSNSQVDITIKHEYFSYDKNLNKLSLINREKPGFLNKENLINNFSISTAWIIKKSLLNTYNDETPISGSNNLFLYNNFINNAKISYSNKFNYVSMNYKSSDINSISDFTISEDWMHYVIV